LSKALARYQRAKERFGLQAILLGEADLAMADMPMPAAKGSAAAAPVAKSGGNGGNGHTSGYKIKCPECAGDLTFEEGCVKCHGCGYAQC
jgi:ribonucleoside-diphosphate reductase alpha chain